LWSAWHFAHRLFVACCGSSWQRTHLPRNVAQVHPAQVCGLAETPNAVALAAPTIHGHMDHSSLKKQHAKIFRNAEAQEKNLPTLTPFVLYSSRHTFLTRLGQPGCDAWTLARVAGHSSIAISSRYVHPSEDSVLNAMASLNGHNSGHRPEIPKIPPKSERAEVIEGKEEKWCARRDSNSRPIAPEAIALSI
jgi:hypothetical protein